MENENIALQRGQLAAFGAIAGLAFWFVVDGIHDLDVLGIRLIYCITIFIAAFFGGAMSMTGPLSLRSAASYALPSALLASLLGLWASFRFDATGDSIAPEFDVMALILIVTLPMPFLIARASGSGLRHYPHLFSEAWGIAVRFIAGWAFVGVFWIVFWLSDALLGLVGIQILETLVREEVVVFVLCGLVLGVGLSVVHELRAYISPVLVVRLLRLLTPLAFVIVCIFVLALPLRGISNLFGAFSAAAILMGFALGSATLVTLTLDRDDESAAQSNVLTWAARGLALLMPILTVLAVYAIWIRVNEYGLTPERVAAAVACLVVAGYSVLYSASAIRSSGWKERLRQANILKAGAIIILAVLWLTPVLDAQRISVNSQFARFVDGRVSAKDFDLWEFANEWGRAGERRVDDLVSSAPEVEQAAMAIQLEKLRAADNKWDFERDVDEASEPDLRTALLALVPVSGGEPIADERILAGLSFHQLTTLKSNCERRTEKGNAGCVAILGDFALDAEGNEYVVFQRSETGYVSSLLLGPDGFRRSNEMFGNYGPGFKRDSDTLIDAIHEGRFQIGPARIQSVFVENSEIFIHP